MANSNSNSGQSSISNFDQKMYTDFSGGYNDTSAAISIEDNQLAMSENADYSAEVKALRTRKGCVKVNNTSFNKTVTDGFAWLIGSVHKKCIVMNGKVYDLNTDTGQVTEKITLTTGAKKIYPFVLYNVLYFGDGSELYVWGQFDYASELGEQTVKNGTIVKCNDSTLGTKGHFYRYKKNTTSTIDLSSENYLNTTNWEDVTDVPNYSSSVVRILQPYDPSQNEIVKITVYSSATYSGTVTLCLNDVVKEINVVDGTSVRNILQSLNNLEFDEWTSEITSESTVTFTCTEKKSCNAGYIDGSTTRIQFAYKTVQEGESSNCDLTDIRKCTVFCVHQGSARVFAAGNPDDNAIYYSEIGYGNYFQSKTNKLYPAINGYGRVTGMCNLSAALVVSYENGWYTWRGITPLQDAYWEPLNIPYGCVEPRTLCLTPQGFTYLSKDGIYTVSAAILNEQYILLQTKQVIKRISEDAVEKTIESFVNKNLCTAVFYDNVYMIAYSTNGEYCDKILKYEWDTGSFTLGTGWIVNNWINDHDNLFFASNNYVLKAFEGYSDIDTETGNPKPIVLHVKTKEYYFDTPQTNKVVQMISFIFQQHHDAPLKRLTSNAQVILHAGYQKYILKESDLAESLYYNRMWGKKWGYREAIVQVAEIVMVSNVFQIEIISDNLDDPVTLLGVGFSYADTDLVLPTILKDEELMI